MTADHEYDEEGERESTEPLVADGTPWARPGEPVGPGV